MALLRYLTGGYVGDTRETPSAVDGASAGVPRAFTRARPGRRQCHGTKIELGSSDHGRDVCRLAVIASI